MVRLEANRPTVGTDDGQELLCHLAGKVRRSVGRIRVGDRVECRATDPGQGVIVGVEARGLTLERPPVANVSGLVMVFTLVDPVGSTELLDRRLILAELYGVKSLLLAHKADRVPPERRAELEPWARLYPLIWTSVQTGEGLADVPRRLGEGIYVLTGESGAGKSSLLAALLGEAGPAAGALTRRQRGRQTTRTVSLHRLGDGYLSDTPGFSRLNLPPMTSEELRWAFPEFRQLRCRFRDCLHRDEPGCALPAARAAGSVSAIRYRHYRTFLEETVH